MKHYIPKSVILGEIDKRIESCAKQREDMLKVQCYTLADDASARMGELNCIKDFLDTIETKEVVAEQEGICNAIFNRIIGDSWNLTIPIDKAGLKHGDKVKVIIVKN